MASTVSFEDLERCNIADMSVLEGLKTKLSSSVREILSECSDRQQALDYLRHKIEGMPMTTGMLTTGKKAELTKFILEAMKDCEIFVESSRKKCDEEIAKAHAAYDLEKSALDEAKDRTRTQERIFNEREKLLIRLPTNQAVIPVHNALLEEHSKERILITDSFKAVKDEKANVREKMAERIEQAEKTYTREHDVHKKEIERYRFIAKISRIKVQDITTDELLDRQFNELLGWSNMSASTAAGPTTSVEEIIDDVDEGNTSQMELLRQMKKELSSGINGMLMNRNDYSDQLISLQESLLTSPTMVDLVPETPLDADQSSFAKVMHDQINLCQYAIAEISQQRNEDVEASTREHQLDIHNLKDLVQKRLAQKARIEKLQRPLGALWETELPEWDQAWTISHDEKVHIKKELEGLENQIARCEENHGRRENAADKLLKQRVKHYKRVIYHVQAEAEQLGISINLTE